MKFIALTEEEILAGAVGCNYCCIDFNSEMCKMLQCCSDERVDKQNGYYVEEKEMIYNIPYPEPDGRGWCGACLFIDNKKEGYDWGYCQFLKKGLTWYDYYLSECDLDYDCEYVLEENKKNEKNTCCTMGTI